MGRHALPPDPAGRPAAHGADSRPARRAHRGPLAVTVLSAAALLVAGLLVGLPPYRTVVHGTGTLAYPGPPPRAQAPAAGPPASRQPAAGSAELTMAFAGDVHFAGRTADRAGLGPDALGPIGRTLAAADIGMVNLESAITERGTEEPKQFHFRAPPAVLDSLRRSGLDLISMANNHAADYGPVGLADTLAAISSHHLPVVGIGADAGQAYAPWYAVVRGNRVAIIAASQIHDRTLAAWTAGPSSPGIASADSDRLVAAVRDARQRADIVVVYLHWGTEGRECPNAAQRSLAGRLAAAGADAVVGTHAHLLLGAGWLHSTYVDFGLGNFLWWRDNAYSNDTGVLTLTFRAGRVVRSTFAPAKIDARGVPVPVAGTQAATIQGKLDRVRRCAGLSERPAG
jgi:poly-gamma-glutamate synthesis protein (capsule biosynthesis protein)